MTYGQFEATVGIIAIVTILIEVAKRALAWNDAQTQRFAALYSVVLGAALGLALWGTAPADIKASSDALLAVLFGIVQGAASVGIYDVGPKQVISKVAGPHQA